MAKDKLPTLSDVQLEIVQIVWDRGEVTVTDAWTLLCERRPVSRNTVVTMMTRLAKKGWLRSRRQGNTFYYSAAIARDTTQKQILRRVVRTVFGGSAEGLVLALLSDHNVSPAEARRIKALLDAAPRSKP